MLTLWLRRDTFLWILVFGLESHLMSLTSLVLEQVLDFWSFMTMYKPVDIKMCRWCGRCWAETLSWQVTIPNANKDPSGEFLNFLATIVNPHHSLQIMHEIKQSDTTKIVTINNVLLLPRKKKNMTFGIIFLLSNCSKTYIGIWYTSCCRCQNHSDIRWNCVSIFTSIVCKLVLSEITQVIICKYK